MTLLTDSPRDSQISRYLAAPECGPRLLFFSGGSAISGLSRQLKAYSHNTIHLLTTFDSGGSSAALRDAFAMPAVGDLRNRLLALANESSAGYAGACALFGLRLARTNEANNLFATVLDIAAGNHPLVSALTPDMRSVIGAQLDTLLQKLPASFDLEGASVGNLILAGSFLKHSESLDAALSVCSSLLDVQGTIQAVVDDHGHLGAELDDGRVLIGQHLLTGKESSPLTAPIRRAFLSKTVSHFEPGAFPVSSKSCALIQSADLICYPPGSFYSSVIANLLSSGVSTAISENPCPKVFIPNLGSDPEQIGMDFSRLIQTLCQYLQDEGEQRHPLSSVLNYLLVDTAHGRYPFDIDYPLLASLGVRVLDLPLVTEASAPYYDDHLLSCALLSLT